MKLKPYEILASSLAALAAASAASVFGVKGTLIGAAIGAAVATTVASLVAQSATRAHDALRRPAAPGRAPSHPSAGDRTRARRPAAEGSSDRRWRVLLVAAGSMLGAFLLALGVVTLVELSAGRSLSSIFGGTNSGTTVGGVIDGVSPPPSTTTTTTTTTTSTTSTTTTTTSPTTTTAATVPTTTTVPGATGTTVPISPGKAG